MIYQEMRRKGFEGCKLDVDKGFYIEGKDYNDCMTQLKEWCKNHLEKWVYYHDCGVAPSKPVPVARNILEVHFFDEEPARPILFSRCIQEGCEGKREIDTMTPEEKSELIKKQMSFFYMLGSNYGNGGANG